MTIRLLALAGLASPNCPIILRAAEGAAGAGGAGGEGGAATDAAAAAAAAGGEGTTTAAGGEGGEGGAPKTKWWEGEAFAPYRATLEAKGLTTDDPLEAMPKALKALHGAEQVVGARDRYMEKPKDGKVTAEWLAQNREMFGIPEKPEEYKLDKPEGWPEDAPWDADLEKAAREKAAELGLSQAQLQGMTGIYAERVKGLLEGAEQSFQNDQAKMLEELQKDWGDQTKARMAMARQAAEAVATAAKLPPDAMEGIAAVLKDKVGDANVIRIFEVFAQAMGEDGAIGLGRGSGGSGGSMTPAEARSELAKFTAQGGEWYEAAQKGDHAKLKELKPRMERLSKAASE